MLYCHAESIRASAAVSVEFVHINRFFRGRPVRMTKGYSNLVYSEPTINENPADSNLFEISIIKYPVSQFQSFMNADKYSRLYF